ncbi:protein of unknown function [Taphrina deformans PYCC 5710]|uniref:Actin-related protein 2/3 complex subunit 3 n=1 Tax=Taphrina deformans (strain PYCC 5710 / ATCC 11124 / CBS 356.35 / IMI 108563 / JCM 9778 / NBRC 8474) TaxID=1097556 RepID=R4XDJ4_TAPDE|nr:protein of unknown function [Taphrina deformans PYCC 5710]|eukprot:CCG83910.1 protein of unknown function [Taphrina deformans PYCC 5710]
MPVSSIDGAYHSSFLEDADTRIIGNFALLPLKTRYKGPSFPPQDQEAGDILDESLELFRANTFFRNFTIDGPSDRTLIYGILFISDCLARLNAKLTPRNEAVKIVNTLALESFAIPGEGGFPLNNVYAAPTSRPDADLLRQYLTQFRQELAQRVVARVYKDDDQRPDKFWLAFTKRKFMGKTLN